MSSHEQLKRLFAFFSLLEEKILSKEGLAINACWERVKRETLNALLDPPKVWIAFQEAY
jgi:hypothetical protein